MDDDQEFYVKILKKNVRLPLERWIHITEAHPELKEFEKNILEEIKTPKNVYYSASSDYYILVQPMAPFITDNLILYIKLLAEDAFVISAHPISDKRLKRKITQWKKLTPLFE